MSRALGRVIWLTGLPRSGKSTLARGLLEELRKRDIATLWLDSDDLRGVMTPNATYSDEERDTFYATVGHVARRAAQGGVTVLISATATRRVYRDVVRALIPEFVEILVHCPDEVLRARDTAGLYSSAEEGGAPNMPGVGAAYEAPTTADLTLDSSQTTPEVMVAAALKLLDERAAAR